MRFLIHWVLAFLLAFEPALATQGAANLQSEFKKFIEISELTKREVTIQELYNKFASALPYYEQQKLKPFLAAYGSTKLPKMDMSKIKGPAGEVYKLSTSANGQAGSLEFTGEANTVFKVNGIAVAPNEAADISSLLVKIGVPEQNVEQAFPQVKKQKSWLLSADEIAQLSKPDQVKYIKNFQAFLVSLEAAQQLQPMKKTSLNSLLQKLEFYSQVFLQDYAWAMKVGDDCIAAGHMTKVNLDKTGRLKCGTIPKGSAGFDEIRKKGDGELCGSTQLSCSQSLFGKNNHCVSAAIDSTRQCKDIVEKSGADIPDLTKEDKAAFDDLKLKAEAQAESIRGICKTINEAKPEGRPKGLVVDQQSTCKDFETRYDTIKSWTCDEGKNAEFKKKYPKLCAAKEAEAILVVGKPSGGADTATGTKPEVGAPQATGQQPTQPVAAGTLDKCDKLIQYSFTRECEYGNYKLVDKPVQCLDAKGDKVSAGTYECVCNPGGTIQARNKCSKGTGVAIGTDSESAGDKTKGGWFSKNSKWLTWLGLGLGGLLLYHWMAKSSAQEFYKNANPTTPNSPVAPTNPTVPIPRSVK